MEEIKFTLGRGVTGMVGAIASQLENPTVDTQRIIHFIDTAVTLTGKFLGIVVALFSIYSLCLSIKKHRRSTSSSSSSLSISSIGSLFLFALILFVLIRL